VCRELAHLYHYSLHGPQGNVPGSQPARVLPSGEAAPEVVVEYLAGARLLWRRNLAEVGDDMETMYLGAQRARLDFTVNVPGKGGRRAPRLGRGSRAAGRGCPPVAASAARWAGAPAGRPLSGVCSSP
jgi:hypothetical protein